MGQTPTNPDVIKTIRQHSSDIRSLRLRPQEGRDVIGIATPHFEDFIPGIDLSKWDVFGPAPVDDGAGHIVTSSPGSTTILVPKVYSRFPLAEYLLARDVGSANPTSSTRYGFVYIFEDTLNYGRIYCVGTGNLIEWLYKQNGVDKAVSSASMAAIAAGTFRYLRLGPADSSIFQAWSTDPSLPNPFSIGQANMSQPGDRPPNVLQPTRVGIIYNFPDNKYRISDFKLWVT